VALRRCCGVPGFLVRRGRVVPRRGRVGLASGSRRALGLVSFRAGLCWGAPFSFGLLGHVGICDLVLVVIRGAVRGTLGGVPSTVPHWVMDDALKWASAPSCR
jgi:hypothetical protein